METIRQKLIPDLTDGFIDLSGKGCPIRPAGSLFCQPTIRTKGGEEKPLDDVVGTGFQVVTKTASILQSIPEDLIGWWHRIGGEVIIFNRTASSQDFEDSICLTESNGVLATFFEEWNCCCVVVRPDRYIYGAAKNGQKLKSILRKMKRQLTS